MKRRCAGLALLAVALPGCGTADDRDQARAATERFYAAFRHHDGAAASAELSDGAVQALEQQEGKPCARPVTGLQLKRGTVQHLEDYITNTKLDHAGHDRALLGRATPTSRLSTVGSA